MPARAICASWARSTACSASAWRSISPRKARAGCLAAPCKSHPAGHRGRGGFLALRLSGDLTSVFVALAVALAAFGLINAVAVAGGAWFGPLRLRWSPRVRGKDELHMTSSIA